MTDKRNATFVGRLASVLARASGHVLITVEKQVETLRLLETQTVERHETQSRLSALQAEFDAAVVSLGAARTQLETAFQELRDSRSAEERAAAEARRMGEALDALSRERDEQCASLQAGLSNMRAGYEGRVGALEASLAQVQEALATQAANIRAGYDGRIKALETDIAASRGSVVRAREAAAARLAALQEEHDKRIETARALLDETRSALMRAQEDKQALGAQIEDERRGRQEEHRRNEAALAATQARIRTMEERIDALTMDLKERAVRLDLLTAEISNTRAGYEQRIAGLDKELEGARADVQRAEEVAALAKRQRADADAARDAATSELTRVRASVEAMRLPAILVVSVVKSGTVFTRQALAKGLGVGVEPIGFGYFPRSLVELPKLKTFSRAGNKIGYSHVDASEANLQILSRFLDRWIVHIRDPRSVLLSWVHHMNRLYSERNNDEFQHLYVSPAPPDEYFAQPLAQQIDWNIENFLPNVVAWTREWLQVVDSGKHNILLTNYSELVRDEGKYLARILDFYGIPRGRWSRPVIAKTLQESHFRTGTEDEWMATFAPDQIARANAAIGEGLFARLGWLRGPDARAVGRAPIQQIRSATDRDR